MAKRRKKKSGGSGKRRRVSGVHPVFMQAAALVGGAALGGIGAAFVNQAIKTSFTTAPAYVGGAVCIAGAAAIPFIAAKPSPLMLGIAGGLAGMGFVFAANETVLSLPGISGVPMQPMSPSTSQGNGYLNRTVGRAYQGIPANRIGNLSGNRSTIVAGILSN